MLTQEQRQKANQMLQSKGYHCVSHIICHVTKKVKS